MGPGQTLLSYSLRALLTGAGTLELPRPPIGEPPPMFPSPPTQSACRSLMLGLLASAIGGVACGQSDDTPPTAIIVPDAEGPVLDSARADIANGLPWRATLRLAPIVADTARTTPSPTTPGWTPCLRGVPGYFSHGPHSSGGRTLRRSSTPVPLSERRPGRPTDPNDWPCSPAPTIESRSTTTRSGPIEPQSWSCRSLPSGSASARPRSPPTAGRDMRCTMDSLGPRRDPKFPRPKRRRVCGLETRSAQSGSSAQPGS